MYNNKSENQKKQMSVISLKVGFLDFHTMDFLFPTGLDYQIAPSRQSDTLGY